MLHLRRLKSSEQAPAFSRTLPSVGDLESSFHELGLRVHKADLSFTHSSSLDEFATICDKFLRPGAEDHRYACRHPYMVRHGVQTADEEPIRDLYAIDFGFVRAAISVDAAT